ncbi:MAG: hypothetical protein DRI28_00110 [Caldiserica bacterium]|nr:MAG: hypothetical protein DRI28_00110 [Caldisericota bacterium]
MKKLLEDAIQAEHDAMRFYKKISDSVKNKIAKKKLDKLSREEESHERKLIKMYRKLFEESFTPEDKFNVNPEFNIVEEKDWDKVKSLDIVKIALQSEIKAIEHYTKMLEKTVDEEDKKYINELIKVEKYHADLLKREYDILKKQDYWDNPTLENLGDLRL